jgi:hypothetical protein
MLDLMHDSRGRRRNPQRHTVEEAGFTVLSVAAALVLLPVIGLKAVAGRLPLVKVSSVQRPEADEHYLIN